MSAIEEWTRRVEAHHAQSDRARAREDRPGDFWRPYASSFRADPRRPDDHIVNRTIRDVGPGTTVLDVGGGAGRLALPLALRAKHVTVVDSSESMLKELRAGVKEADIDNVTAVEGMWEDVDVPVADLVLCAHVVYGVEDVAPFVRKLESHARDSVLIVAFMDAPQSSLGPFWKAVHGEDRVDLPALRHLMGVLWEMDIYPDLEMFETDRNQTYETHQDALEQMAPRLYVAPHTDQERRLREAVHDLLVETPEGLVLQGERVRRQGLVKWTPG